MDRPRLAPRRYRPLSVTLLRLVSLLVITAALGIGLATYLNTRSAVDRFSQELFTQALLQTRTETNRFLGQAQPILELSRALLSAPETAARYGVFAPRPPSESEWRARAALFIHILRTNSAFSMIYYGDRWGDFTAASRAADGGLLVDHRRAQPDAPTRHELFRVTSAGWKPEHNPSVEWSAALARYRPQDRPWYRPAIARKRITWTLPYRFAHPPYAPGITASLPLFRPHGTAEGVFGVDFPLTRLDLFVGSLQPLGAGSVFILAGQSGAGGLIAHPERPAAESGSHRPERRTSLLPAWQSLDRVVRAAAERLQQQGRTGSGTRFLEFMPSENSLTYLAAADHLQIENLPITVIVTVPQTEILGVVTRNNLLTLLICAGVLLLSVVAGALLAARIARPLRQCVQELQQIGQFVLEDRPTPSSAIEEVDALAQEMVRMKTSLRSFEKYVPTGLVRALVQSGREARLGGSTEVVTVFFSDIVDFTQTAEGMTPSELVEAMAEYLQAMEEVISTHEGIVDKYVGDAVMALWGTSVAPVNMPENRACAAALEFLENAVALQAQRAHSGKPVFEAHISIHTGEALVGNIGSRHRMDYTAIGDAVNIASRMQALNRLYGARLLISEATHAKVHADFDTRFLDTVLVKGRAHPIGIYEILTYRGDLDPARRQLCEQFAVAMDCYRAHRWDEALERFQRGLDLVPDDGPSRVFVERCRGYRETPPPESWDCVWQMTIK